MRLSRRLLVPVSAVLALVALVALSAQPAGEPAGPSPSPVAVQAPAELERLLAEDRPAWIGRTVVVEGEVLPGTCIDPAPCTLGTLVGTGDTVFASEYTSSLLPAADRSELGPLLALRVLSHRLEYLGRFVSWTTDRLASTPLDRLDDPDVLQAQPLAVTAVEGWLVGMGSSPCPFSPGPTVPPDTPFMWPCAGGYITAQPFEPYEVIDMTNGQSIRGRKPGIGIVVQSDAYQAFAPDPRWKDDRWNTEPRHGTYLVRLVRDPRPGLTDRTGWQVVARIVP